MTRGDVTNISFAVSCGECLPGGTRGRTRGRTRWPSRGLGSKRCVNGVRRTDTALRSDSGSLHR